MHIKKDSNKSNTFIQGLRPFSKTIPRGLKKLLKKGSYNFSNIIDNWTKMIGKDISNICYPNTIKMGKEMNNGTLVLNVIHGNELTVEYSKQEIIDKINSFFGFRCIEEVRLKIVQERKNSKQKKMTDKIKKNYNNNLDSVNNENLKKSLNKLIEAYNAKNN
ncbi:DUF721 domain-containing protein [Pelagibacteraceae bacterium]|nr:DUF721 domain-containing protein [Pelagibacteraceae bacterium]